LEDSELENTRFLHRIREFQSIYLPQSLSLEECWVSAQNQLVSALNSLFSSLPMDPIGGQSASQPHPSLSQSQSLGIGRVVACMEELWKGMKMAELEIGKEKGKRGGSMATASSPAPAAAPAEEIKQTPAVEPESELAASEPQPDDAKASEAQPTEPEVESEAAETPNKTESATEKSSSTKGNRGSVSGSNSKSKGKSGKNTGKKGGK
jgi:hypothetical protein